MKNSIILFLIFISLFSCQRELDNNQKTIVAKEWDQHFKNASVEGTFVLAELNSDSILVYNLERANKKYLPASTFKIPNSLITLESNVIEDEKEILKWDGKKRFYNKWNQDQNMKSAFKYSCVWFYQELARRVGREKMQYFIDTLDYGNHELGENVDDFWLNSSLKISAVGQINFLTKFLNRDLPFSERNFDIVEKVMMVDSTESYRLYAKTGWGGEEDNEIGWYVGFVKNEKGNWIFALNIDIKNDEDADQRKIITGKILRDKKIIR